MDRCTWETRQLLQRILAGWFELASVLPELEQHLAETTGYPVQVQPRPLSVSAARIAKFLAEDHRQPAAAIGHLHDWLVGVQGNQLRGDWVAFLALVQNAPGLAVDQRAELVAIADVLCFPPVPPLRTDGRRLVEMATHARVIGSPSLLLEELALKEPHLAQHAREAVERVRTGPPPLPPTDPREGPRERPPGERGRARTAAALALLAAAGLAAALLWPDGPPPLPARSTVWHEPEVRPGNVSTAEVDVPAGATRLKTRLLLSDVNPDSGSCTGLTARLGIDQHGSSGWQAPGTEVTLPVPAGLTHLSLNLQLSETQGCVQKVDIQRVEFTR
ncbi:hypothetical protein Kpho02_52430 [Kitasatospora phosalacinea]|uniref:Uncharacterized protein n=1 Tax=Kitasatospora phosalacinea TaxID=2065 RepID=A0A9W6QB20_9ACTN|nr:hypothetical protein [Kitasatospora phosalacinea]GLW72944.1 hypothetical protein Kpho02_52430 [Kitasatospora phosalacinea]